jgi:hypothetical protein
MSRIAPVRSLYLRVRSLTQMSHTMTLEPERKQHSPDPEAGGRALLLRHNAGSEEFLHRAGLAHPGEAEEKEYGVYINIECASRRPKKHRQLFSRIPDR